MCSQARHGAQVMGTHFDPVVKDARTLADPQHGHTLETERRSGMMRIVFGCGGFVKRENGGSSGAGFCQSRDAELSHPSTGTSPDFDERVVLSWYVSSANVHFKNTSRRCGREKIHWTVSFGFLNLRACFRAKQGHYRQLCFRVRNQYDSGHLAEYRSYRTRCSKADVQLQHRLRSRVTFSRV